MRPPARLVPLVLLAVTPLAACSGDSDDDDGGADGFGGMLADVPAGALDGDAWTLQYVDMGLVWERLGVGDGTAAEKLEALPQTAKVETFGLVPRLFDQMSMATDDAVQEVGFDVTAVDREIAVDAPPSELRILDVAVGTDVVAEATASDPTWSDRRQEVDAEVGAYFDWTEGDELASDVGRRTPMRPLGIGGQLAVTEQGDGARIVRTKESALVEDALRTAAGDGGSAADEGPLAGITDALDGDVVQVIAVDGPIRAMPATLSPDQLEQLGAGGAFLGTYRAVVVAEQLVDGESSTEVLIVHGSEQAAEANARAVERQLADEDATTMSGVPISEVLGAATVELAGTIVRVALEPQRFARALDAIMRGDIFVTN
jgi:hypothetical protein